MLLRPRVQLIGSTSVINNSVSQDSVKLKAFFRVLGEVELKGIAESA